MEFIFDTIFTRLKFVSSRCVPFEQDSMSNNDNSENIERTPWFLISYTNTASDKFLKICKKENLKSAFYNNNKFNRLRPRRISKE